MYLPVSDTFVPYTLGLNVKKGMFGGKEPQMVREETWSEIPGLWMRAPGFVFGAEFSPAGCDGTWLDQFPEGWNTDTF